MFNDNLGMMMKYPTFEMLYEINGKTEEEINKEYGNKQIVDILLAIRQAREKMKKDEEDEEDLDLWNRVSRAV